MEQYCYDELSILVNQHNPDGAQQSPGLTQRSTGARPFGDLFICKLSVAVPS